MIGNVILLATFTLVTNGNISTVPTVGSGSTLRVSAQAVVDMASASGRAVQADAGAGVISVSEGAPTSVRLKGFSGSKVVFVVDGQIIRSASRSVNGIPYVPADVLEQIAEKMGFSAQLEASARVLALQRSDSGSVAARDPQPDLDPYGLTDGARIALGQSDPSASDGDVCSYMDQLKRLWDSTEPSIQEKATFRRLANDFRAMNAGTMKKDRSQVRVLKRMLASFGEKVDKRESGTKDLEAPGAASGVRETGLEFLAKVQTVMTTSEWLTKQMSPDSEATKSDVEKAIKKLEAADRQVQSTGAAFNQQVLRVRGQYGCGPP